jgi:hypothetical protein
MELEEVDSTYIFLAILIYSAILSYLYQRYYQISYYKK